MGLVRATAGALGGTLADQWKDFLTVPGDLAPTSALFPAVPVGANARRGSNTSASTAVVTNGSRIVVPEGYGLLLLQEGALTGFVSEPGGYTWDVDSPYSQSVFGGDDWSTSLIKQSWERFKFGGRPGAQQLALFVCLKELPNNRFGTQSTIYWDDRYLNAQVGAIAHGTYSVNILDPILFASDFVPATYLQGLDVFDFTDRANPAANQLFLEVVGSLAAAFSLYANDEERSNRIASLQKDSLGFAASLAQVVEDSYQWLTTRGLAMSKATIVGIEYDDPTRELLKTVQRADALSGSRGNANLQASVAAGLEAAGEQGGSSAILGMGVAGGSIGLASLMQDEAASGATKSASGPSDLLTTLENLQRAHEAGLISKEEFEAAKAKALGLS